MATQEVDLSNVIPAQVTAETAADTMLPATSPTTEAEQTPAEQQPTDPMLDRLRQLGCTVVEVTPTGPIMERALAPSTGMTHRQVEEKFALAFNKPDKADQQLLAAGKAARAAIERDRGEIVAVALPGSKPFRTKPAIVACGVSEQGTVFLAAREYSGRKPWSGNWGQRSGLLKDIRAVGTRAADQNGITANLLPRGRGEARKLVQRILNPKQSGGTRVKKNAASNEDAPKTPLTDSLTQLNPDATFTTAPHGYTLPGIKHAAAMLDPERNAHRRMVRIGRLGQTLGRSALGLRWRAGKRSAKLFAEMPEVWQPLAHIAGGVEGQIAQGAATRNPRASLIKEARRKLAEVQEGAETLSAEHLATVVGASLLAKYSKQLRNEMSAKLAARYPQPAALPKPEKPQKPARIGLWRWITSSEARQQKRHNDAAHIRSMKRYGEQLTAFQANQRELGQYPVTHGRLTRDGGKMLQTMLTRYVARTTHHVRESIFFWDSNKEWSMEDVAAVINTPSRLPDLYKSAKDKRNADKVQVWEHVYGLVKKTGKMVPVIGKAVWNTFKRKPSQTTATN